MKVHSSLGWHIFFSFISSDFSPKVRLFNFSVNMIIRVPEFLISKAVDSSIYHIWLNAIGAGLLAVVVIGSSESPPFQPVPLVTNGLYL